MHASSFRSLCICMKYNHKSDHFDFSSNFNVMIRYIADRKNLQLVMNLLRDKSPNIQFEAFHVFKVCLYLCCHSIYSSFWPHIPTFFVFRCLWPILRSPLILSRSYITTKTKLLLISTIFIWIEKMHSSWMRKGFLLSKLKFFFQFYIATSPT